MFARSLMSVVAAALVASPVLAQVAPPPPPPAEPEPEFVPPPMPKPRTPPPNLDRRAVQAPRQTNTLPDLPYPPLWTFCGTEDPKIDEVCRFDDNLHYIALRANPTVSTGIIEGIQGVIEARRARFELLVIEHLDIATQIDAGMLEEVGISDPTSLQELLQLVKPLTPPTNLTQELQARGVLTATQAQFNNKIIGEYQRAYGEYLRRIDLDTSTDLFMRSMFEDSLLESVQALNGMLHESRVKMEAVLSKVDGVPAETQSALLELAIEEFKIPPNQIKASADKVKFAWRPLTMAQKSQFLGAVRELRANPDIPPIPTIVVMHPGKVVNQKSETIKRLEADPSKITPERREKIEKVRQGQGAG